MKHNVTIEYPVVKVRALFNGTVLASTTTPILLKEGGGLGYEPVFYFPEADVNKEYLSPSDTRSDCYLKGESRYWSLNVKNKKIDDVAWEYHRPIQGMEAMKGYVAFYSAHIEVLVEPF